MALSDLSRERGHIVRLWKSQQEAVTVNVHDMHVYNSTSSGEIRITTWKCRGVDKPAIHQEFNGQWLWCDYPFRALAVAFWDAETEGDPLRIQCRVCDWLTPEWYFYSCRGVSILWKRFDVTSIGEIDSDQICGIRLRLTYLEMKELTILRVYSPGADAGIDKYVQVLWELERLINEGQRVGPVLVGGYFNAHLGALGRVRGLGEPNKQGVLSADLFDRCEMYAPSLSAIAKGTSYTFVDHLTLNYSWLYSSKL